MNTRKHTRNLAAATVAALLVIASTGASAMRPEPRHTLPAEEREKVVADKRDNAAETGPYRVVNIGGRVGEIMLPIRDR